MKFQEIAKTIKGNERKEIQDAIKENQEYMRNYSKYKQQPLLVMFVGWEKLFPTNKQDIKCSSCRRSVLKFWDEINKEWLSEKSIPTPKKKTKKHHDKLGGNLKDAHMRKKSSTLTGAMAKGVGTSK